MLKLMLHMICLILFFNGCNRNMRYQASYKAFERPLLPPEHTVPMKEAERVPELSRQTLTEGQVLFEKNCSVCHGLTGDGKGLVTYKGLTPPPSFIEPRLLNSPPDYIVKTVTHGFGKMPSLQRRLNFQERWKVAYYVKALQLSRHFPAKELSKEDRSKLP